MSHAVSRQCYYWNVCVTMNKLDHVINIAIKAGEATLPYFYHADTRDVTLKSDQSPVTQADIASNTIIMQGLKSLTPDIPILSEEAIQPNFDIRASWQEYWLVDPLDGTRGFIGRFAEYTVNIALIVNHKPVLGVLYSPVDQRCYFAEKNQGAYLSTPEKKSQRIYANTNIDSMQFICGRFDRTMKLKNTLLRDFKNVSIKQMNSAVKFGVIAEGAGDLYVRWGSTCEWDTAAGQCILEEAGGAVVDFDGNRLRYNTKSSLINPFFLAIGDASQTTRLVKWINQVLEQYHE